MAGGAGTSSQRASACWNACRGVNRRAPVSVSSPRRPGASAGESVDTGAGEGEGEGEGEGDEDDDERDPLSTGTVVHDHTTSTL